MDTNIFLTHPGYWNPSDRRLASALVLILSLTILVSGCVDKTEAASELAQSPGDYPSALASEERLIAQGGTVLHFGPASAQVAVDQVVAVQIRLENVENLYGIEVHLAFNKDVVQVEDDDPTRDGIQIAFGELPYPDFTVQNTVDNFGGWLDYAVVQLSPRSPVSGSGVVATIRFRGVRAGTSVLHITHAKLASPDGFAIPATWQDGSIVVGEAVGPTPTSPPTATSPPLDLTPTVPPTDTPAPAVTPSVSAAETPTPTPTQATTCPTLYLVRSGDTAYSIARRFGIPLGTLAASNELPASYVVKIGQLLVIPGVPGPTGTLHPVQAGETLYSIARQHGTSVETLAAINRLPYPWHVGPGKTLLICPP